MAASDTSSPSTATVVKTRTRSASAAGELSILDLLRIVWRRKLLILAVLALGAAGVAIAYKVYPRSYTAHALLVVETAAGDAALDIESEVAFLRSRSIARAVVDRRLSNGEPDLREPPRDLASLVRSFVAAPARGDAPEAAPQSEAIAHLQAGLEVSRQGKSQAIDVAYTSADPEEAAALANAVVERYVDARTEKKLAPARRVGGLLERRVLEARAEVGEAQRALDTHRLAPGQVPASSAASGEHEAARLAADLVRARLEHREAVLRRDRMQAVLASGDRTLTALDLERSSVLQRLASLEIDARRRLVELSAHYGAKHPKIIDASREAEELRQRIAQERRALLAKLENEVAITREAEATLSAALAQVRATVSARSQHAQRLAQLEVELERKLDTYNELTDRLETSSGEVTASAPVARIISRATPPQAPSTPDLGVLLTIGLLASATTASLAVYLAELANAGFRSASEVEETLGLPVLGVYPQLRQGRRKLARPHDLVIDRRRSRYAEALRGTVASLVTSQVERGEEDGRGLVVLLTSSVPDEGKTTTAISLARTVALEGMRVLLVDADFHHPSVAAALGLKPAPGLLDVLRGDIQPGRAVRADPRSAVQVLAGSAGALHPTRLLGRSGFGAFIERARLRFEVVIVDTAPLLAVTDARLLALHADRTLLCVSWGRTQRALVQGCAQQLQDGGVEIAGVLVNEVDLTKHARFDWRVSAFAQARLAAYYSD